MFKIELFIAWVKKNKVKTILIIMGLFFLPLMIVHLLFKWNTGISFFYAEWSAGDLIEYIAGFEAFIGTVVLGIIAVWQTSKANDISKSLMELENNKYRPYIKLGIGNIFYINKKAYAFSDEVEIPNDESTIKYEGIAKQDEQYKNNINCYWPIAAIFIFNIENLGESSISTVSLKRFLVFNNGIGIVTGFTRSMDTSLFAKSSKTVVVCVKEQVPVIEDGGAVYNRISNEHAKMLQLPIRLIQIEMTLEYTDIFGRTFIQEYTIHLGYELLKENQTEYEFSIKDPSIEHHIGLSPYGPRSDEEK